MKNTDYEKINQELVTIIQAGGRNAERATEKLLSVNSALLNVKIRRYSAHQLFEDIKQAAIIALYKSAQNFSSGASSFGSYAATKIDFAIKDELRRHGRTVHIDFRTVKKYSAMLDTGDFVSAHLTTAKSIDESFEDQDHNSAELQDNSDDALSTLMQNEDFSSLSAAVDSLQPKYKEIIQRRFYNNETLQSIATEKGITPQAVKYFEAEILKKLKSSFKNK